MSRHEVSGTVCGRMADRQGTNLGNPSWLLRREMEPGGRALATRQAPRGRMGLGAGPYGLVLQ